jgi:hypothetical protein
MAQQEQSAPASPSDVVPPQYQERGAAPASRGPFPPGLAVAATAFVAVLLAGLGWAWPAFLLGVVAVVAGFRLLFAPFRLRPGSAYALTGIAIGVAACLLAPVLAGGGPPKPEPTPSPVPTGGRTVVRIRPLSVSATSVAPDSTDSAGHTVSFAATNATDDDFTTTWRVRGTGEGEGLIFAWSTPVHFRQIRLTVGYTQRDPVTGQDLFTQNRRVQQVTVLVSGKQQTFTLDSTSPQLQVLQIDVTAPAIGIRIDKTTSAPLDFAAISEVRFWAEKG